MSEHLTVCIVCGVWHATDVHLSSLESRYIRYIMYTDVQCTVHCSGTVSHTFYDCTTYVFLLYMQFFIHELHYRACVVFTTEGSPSV